MSSTIDIFLDNYNGVCYPGQTIAGRVDCNFNKQKNLRAIRIKFKGSCATQWTESERYYDHHSKTHKTRHVTYSAEEQYFNAEYNLVQGGENFSLSGGRHSYPFSYILPQQLPSSFEDYYGGVRYSIKATVDRPWKFDYEASVALNIVSPLDLNYLPGVREPAANSVDKHLGCCWCKSGPLTFDVSLPATGYVPGQDVNIGAYVQNMSNVTADCVKFKIVKEVEFIAHHPSTRRKYAEHTVIECGEGAIGAHGEKSWTSVLKIPVADSFPNLIPSSLINMTYRLKAKVVLPCPHSNLDTDFPFMIGTVPLTGLNTSIPGPPPSTEYTLSSMEFPPASGELPLPNYNSLPAPYPPKGATAPPPEATPLLSNSTAPYPGDTKYPPNNTAPYPSPGAVPYPSGDPSSAGAPYLPAGPPYPSGGAPSPSGGPPQSSGGPPYPSGRPPFPSGTAPYPSGGAPYPPEPAKYPPSAGWSQPGSDLASAPPSYEEAKQLNEKNGKPL